MVLLEKKKNNGICVHRNVILPLMTNTSISNKLLGFYLFTEYKNTCTPGAVADSSLKTVLAARWLEAYCATTKYALA